MVVVDTLYMQGDIVSEYSRGGCVMAKGRVISLRVTENWYEAAKIGAEEYSLQVGLPCSANLFIELALIEFLLAQGRTELASLARRVDP